MAHLNLRDVKLHPHLLWNHYTLQVLNKNKNQAWSWSQTCLLWPFEALPDGRHLFHMSGLE